MNLQISNSIRTTASQKMIQSSAILQMNTLELRQYLEQLALENPMMEFQTSYDESAEKQEWLRTQDEQNRVYEREERKNAADALHDSSSAAETLSDSLLFQLNGLSLTSAEQNLLKYMILNLESSGYLEMPLEDIAAATGHPLSEIAHLLSILQSLEPEGVGARSLQECLEIQLRRSHPEDHTALEIVSGHLEMVGKNQLPALAKKLRQPLDEILRACKVIRSLNPRPGSCFGERKYLPYIHPELIIVKFKGYYDILLNDSSLPPIHFNRDYLQMLEQGISENAAAYLLEKKKQLEWVADCIRRRNELLLNLGHLIVEHQQDFFRYGPGHRQIFSQAEAASILGVHESSVSRALKDKYLQCSFGIFPLNYFFVQGTEQRDQIQLLIREFISGEDKKHPLSDQAISRLLEEKSISVSKRLVTKYRSELGIPDSSLRRTYEKGSHPNPM